MRMGVLDGVGELVLSIIMFGNPRAPLKGRCSMLRDVVGRPLEKGPCVCGV